MAHWMASSARRLGFTVIEMMAVVAIVSVIAVMAIPNFQVMVARSRQSEAKTELSRIYIVEKSFYSEFQSYHWDLASIGVIPDGFNQVATTYYTGPTKSARFYYTGAGLVPAGCTAEFPGCTACCPRTFGALNVQPSAHVYSGGFAASPRRCDFASDNTLAGGVKTKSDWIGKVYKNNFVAESVGCPRRNVEGAASIMGTQWIDVWTINETRKLENIQSGI